MNSNSKSMSKAAQAFSSAAGANVSRCFVLHNDSYSLKPGITCAQLHELVVALGHLAGMTAGTGSPGEDSLKPDGQASREELFVMRDQALRELIRMARHELRAKLRPHPYLNYYETVAKLLPRMLREDHRNPDLYLALAECFAGLFEMAISPDTNFRDQIWRHHGDRHAKTLFEIASVVAQKRQRLFPGCGDEKPPPPADERLTRWLARWIHHCAGAARILHTETGEPPEPRVRLIEDLMAYPSDTQLSVSKQSGGVTKPSEAKKPVPKPGLPFFDLRTKGKKAKPDLEDVYAAEGLPQFGWAGSMNKNVWVLSLPKQNIVLIDEAITKKRDASTGVERGKINTAIAWALSNAIHCLHAAVAIAVRERIPREVVHAIPALADEVRREANRMDHFDPQVKLFER
jgi:hypothetical protein